MAGSWICIGVIIFSLEQFAATEYGAGNHLEICILLGLYWICLWVFICACKLPYHNNYYGTLIVAKTDTKLFALKRKEQIQTAEQVWAINDYAKQYKTVTFIAETIFPVRISILY
jgi:hypothetical protein